MSQPALRVLQLGAQGLAPHFRAWGELHDPVFDEPTQYGTAYYAYVNATLATTTDETAERALYAERARLGLEATLRHILDPDSHAPITRYYPAVGSPSTANLRDFMWPPALQALRLLRRLGVDGVDRLADMVSDVPVPEAFNKRPPVNWASVWMAGEWLRIADGLSPHSAERMDEWLDPFFAEAVDIERGLYREPGLPNSYDLFTRVHLLQLLVDGYDGAHRKDLERLVVTGLRRSLAVQLSNGSLASAHRSTGQTWTLGAQCSYFHHAAGWVADEDPGLAAAARAAAVRSLEGMAGCFRANGELSPVENVFPADHRIGYEVYTSDPHYVSLPLGFLATAVLSGFTGEREATIDRPPAVLVDPEPFNRAVLHGDGWSVNLNLTPVDGYVTPDQAFDAFGIADITTGERRRLRFGGQVHHVGTQTPLAVGLAVHGADRAITPLASLRPAAARAVAAGDRTIEASAEFDDVEYRIAVEVRGDELRVVESAGRAPVSLLVPYLRDYGGGTTTHVTTDAGRAVLVNGRERIEVVVDGEVSRVVHLPHGYESRHGLVGLVRFDLAAPGPVTYRLRRVL